MMTVLTIVRDNPYVHTYRCWGETNAFDEYAIELNTSISVDQRRYNAPTMEQAAAIWIDASDIKRKFQRSIMLHGRSREPCYIRAYHGCYDPLAYPLFFYPGGETGWEDKKILLEELPMKRFPRVKKKYTRRKKPGIARLYSWFFYAPKMWVLFIK